MDTISTFHPNLYLIFEILGVVSFVAIMAREIYQKNWHKVLEIFCALVFGMILEIGNTYIGHSYNYSTKFAINIFNVPLGIGMYWALIIYSAMLLSDQYRFPWYIRPFMDALTAIILDLYLDVVAVRLGFWSWVIPSNQEWYGIPFDNLAGWVFVVLSFSFLIRFIRTLNLKRPLTKIFLVLSPFIAYLVLMFLLSLFGMLSTFPYLINHWSEFMGFNYRPDLDVLYNPQVQLWKTIFLSVILAQIVHIVTSAMIKYHKKYVWRFDLLSFTILTGMHVFILITLFTSNTYKELPIFIFIGFGLFTIHLLMHFLPHMLQDKKIIYFFKDSEKLLMKEERVLEKIIDEKLR